MYFDARAAKLLQPGQHLVVDGCLGLRLEARASRKTWIYRYKLGKQMKQAKIGVWPTMPVQAAVSAWQDLRNGKAAGVDPQVVAKPAKASATPASANDTVRAVVHAHIATMKAARTEKAAAAAERMLNRLLDEEPEFAERKAASITRAEAYKILDDRKAFPTNAAKLRSMLGAAWDQGLDAGELGEAPNWWRQVLKGKLKSKGKIMNGEHQGRTKVLIQPEKLGPLVAWCRENMHSVGFDMMQIYLRTGTRGSEIASMQPKHIAEEKTGLWWTIPKALTKNAKIDEATDLRVPLVGEAKAIVQRRLGQVGKSGHLFEGEDGEVYEQKRFSNYVYDQQPYSPKSRRRGTPENDMPVSGWTPHNLRRTARTYLASLGCPKEIAEAIVGHMPEQIEGTYNAYSYDKERLQWLQALGDYIDQLEAGLPARP